uniref:Small ubiquitin-related modifier 3 n=1 Tax=Echeneis naucrates TaxID=173247 RepID=A0A665WNZ3_ECHNA
MSEEKPKEGVKTENDHINLKVAGQDGSVVQFKIKRHTPLSKLMKAYCERQVSHSTPYLFITDDLI